MTIIPQDPDWQLLARMTILRIHFFSGSVRSRPIENMLFQPSKSYGYLVEKNDGQSKNCN